ncbi:hypothetical protein NMY22_g7935 [Coprinellus aureogranulatus]|nr:hypothetical protein NMY22_g7935 [Coprinellus aureogranulatus]
MVTANPLFRGTWTLRRLQSTILSDIWPEMIFFSLVATVVALVQFKTDTNLAIGNQLLTVGGVVLGLVISFRTSSAYERYQDGSKMWTNIGTASRNLAQQIWIHVPDERQLSDKEPTPILHVIIEKKTMINMIHAFAVSVKHLLRDEPGVFYDDLYPSVAFLPKYPTPTRRAADILPIWHIQAGRRLTPAALKRRDTLFGLVEATVPPLKPASLPPRSSIYDYIPILKLPRWSMKKAMEKVHLLGKDEDDEEYIQLIPKKKRIAYSDVVESTVPLEIYLVLSNYSAFLMRNNQLQPAVATAMTNALLALHDSLAQLERICNNPLPFAYHAHLRMTVWLYLLFFPFQIVELFGYYTILATGLVTCLLCGFMELGQEIPTLFTGQGGIAGKRVSPLATGLASPFQSRAKYHTPLRSLAPTHKSGLSIAHFAKSRRHRFADATMSAHFPITSSAIVMVAFAVSIAGAYIYAYLQARWHRNLEIQLETALRQSQIRDSPILVLAGANKGSIGETLALARTKEPEALLPSTRNDDRWSTQRSTQQLEELSKENAQLRARLDTAKAELAVRDYHLRTLARAQEGVERHRAEQNNRILELNDKLSECYRRLTRKASLHPPLAEVPLEAIIAIPTRTTPRLVITHRHSWTESTAKRSRTAPWPEVGNVEGESWQVGWMC